MPVPNFGEPEAQQFASWLHELKAQFSYDWTERLASVQRSEELAAAWSRRQRELAKRRDDLEVRADALAKLAAAADRNPLRNRAFLAQLPADIVALKAEMKALGAEVERLPDELEAGRRAVVADRAGDLSIARDLLSAPAANGEQLTVYLFREQVTDLVSELASWLQWSRTVMPAHAPQTHSAAGRGEDVVFAGSKRPPQVLLRRLDLAGTMYLAGQPVPLEGVLTDFTTEPWLLDRPMVLELKSRGSPHVAVRMTLDRSGAVPRDEILVDCREFTCPQMALGAADGLQLSLGSATGALNVSLQLEDDRLSGDVQLVQSGVCVSTAVSESLTRTLAADRLQGTLGSIGSAATRLSLRGTLAEPKCTLWSNLGPAAAKAVEIAVADRTEERARELAVRAQRRVDEQLAQLDRKIGETQSSVAAQLEASGEDLAVMAAEYRPQQRLDAARLGRLPAQSLFR
jgi:uncharacterized protein (TIGR03545 family)